MTPIKIPISICPHTSAGKLRGWYVLAKRLFKEDDPILFKRQFLGFNGSLLITVVRPNEDTIFSMFEQITKYSELEDKEVKWFGQCSLFPLKGGFKVYIPEGHLRMEKPKRIETIGVFRKHEPLRFGKPVYYLEIPAITAEVLLGRKELK
jgi:hypothetical protein